jgi:hypothetical protein
MARTSKTKTLQQPSQQSMQQLEQELRQQLADEAQHLRSLAAAVRVRLPTPKYDEYKQTGRAPYFQRDNETWVKNIDAAYAYDEAAARLEEALRRAQKRA